MLDADADVKKGKKKGHRIHLTDAEWMALMDAAKLQGLSASQLVASWIFIRNEKPPAQVIPDRLIQELESAIRQNADMHLAFHDGITPIPTMLVSALWANTAALNAVLERLGKC